MFQTPSERLLFNNHRSSSLVSQLLLEILFFDISSFPRILNFSPRSWFLNILDSLVITETASLLYIFSFLVFKTTSSSCTWCKAAPSVLVIFLKRRISSLFRKLLGYYFFSSLSVLTFLPFLSTLPTFNLQAFFKLLFVCCRVLISILDSSGDSTTSFWSS